MDVLMPQLGETVAEGKIVKWFKAAGDAVKPGENLFEIETDKTSMEVPATTAGTLSDIRFQVGETAKVGAVVAIINDGRLMGAPQAPFVPAQAGTQGSKSEAPKEELDSRLRGNERQLAAAPPPQVSLAPIAAALRDIAQPALKPRSVPLDPFQAVRTPERNYGPARLPGGAFVTPLARRLASERGIDLARLSGSGPRGRIVAADIDNAPSRGRAVAAGASAAEVKALFAGTEFEEVPLDGMRRTIAARLIEAKQTVPHFYLTGDVDVGRLMAMREEANGVLLPNPSPHAGEGRVGALSLNDFIIKAWAAALQRVPAANAIFAEDRILRFRHSDIGVAVALDDGLVTPVIRNAEQKSLTAISAEMRDLAARARERKLQRAEYQGGASAISNLGMHGVREFAAIINPPHATILAVGATRRAPVEAEDGGVKFISQMTVTLSCDHRAIDGALGAQLLAAFKRLIENPVAALV
jgi:pyruvate dehydrogenase E2 component (dihydrolipoamide acetyltransferase)